MFSKAMAMMLTLVFMTAAALAEDEFSPWEAWRQGFSNYEKGEQCRNRGDSEAALKYFQCAREYYVAVQNNRPEWNQKIIGSRIKMCDQEINQLKREMKGAEKPAAAPPAAIPPAAAISSFGRETETETAELKAELEKYKKKLFAVLVEVDELRRQAERGQSASREVENMIREKGELQQQLSVLQQKYAALSEKAARPDMEKSELKNRMLEEKMKMEILNQKLKMQDDNYEKLRREMAELYKEKTEAKFAQQRNEQKIRELNDQALRYERDAADRGAQIRALNTQLEQLTANANAGQALVTEKQEEIARLNKWLEELREKGGSQNKMVSEVMNENKEVRTKFDSLKEQSEKLAAENQELKNKQLEQHIAFTRLKDTVKMINDQKNGVVDEYNNLIKKYNQSILTEAANTKEIQSLREQNSRLDRDLKLFVDKYERIQKRLEERSANEYQTVLAVNKNNSELMEKLNAKIEELTALRLKYEQLSKANQNGVNAIADLKAKLHALNAENGNLRDEAKELAAARNEARELQRDNQDLRREKAAAASELKSLKNEAEKLQAATSELRESRKQLEELKREAAELKNADKLNAEMREELNAMIALKAENKQLNEQLAKDRRAVAELQDKNTGLAERADKARQALETLENEKQNLHLQLTEKEKALAAGKEENLKALAAGKEENLKALAAQQQIHEALKAAAKNDHDKIASMTEINKRLSDALEKSKNEGQSLEQTVNGLKFELAALNENRRRAEQATLNAGQLQRQLDKLLAEKNDVQNELKAAAELKKENAELKTKLRELNDLKSNYHALNSNYQEALEQLKRLSGNSADEMNKKLGAMLDKAGNEKRELAERIVAMQSELAAARGLKPQLAELEQALKEYKSKCQAVMDSNLKINLELAKVDELKKANAALTAKVDEAAALRQEYKQLQASYQQALQSVRDYQQSDKNKLAAMDELSKKLTAMLDKARAENQKQARELETLKQDALVIPALKAELAALKNTRDGNDEIRRAQTAQLTALQEQLERAMTSVATLQKQVAERESAAVELKLRLAAAGKADSARLGALAAELRERDAKIQALERQLAGRTPGAAAMPATAMKLQDLLAGGIAAEKNHDIEVALWHFQMALEGAPDNLVAHRHLGRIYLQMEDYEKAVAHLARAVKADGGTGDSATDYGLALLGAKRYDSAVEIFKKLLNAQPDNAIARFGLGCVWQGKGEVAAAEKEFRTALKAKPDSVEIMQRLALLLAGDKAKSREAAELYRKSRKLGGGPEPELEKLTGGSSAAGGEAVTFLQQAAADAEKSKDWGAAVWYCSQLADLQPGDAEIKNKVGMLYLLQNAPDKALKAVKADAGDISALLIAAEAWIFKGNPAKALELYAKAQAAAAREPGYRRPELLKALDATVELKIKGLSSGTGADAEKALAVFRQFTKQ